jgi:hypothetical protein
MDMTAMVKETADSGARRAKKGTLPLRSGDTVENGNNPTLSRVTKTWHIGWYTNIYKYILRTKESST